MNQDIKTVAPSTTVEEARAAMKVSRIHHLLVGKGANIVGLVSDRDLGGRAGAKDLRPVADVMTTQLVTARPDMTIREAANLFRGRSIGCLPIVEGNKPVGIVTTTDLLELLGRGSERPVERATRWTLRNRGPRRAGATARRARRG